MHPHQKNTSHASSVNIALFAPPHTSRRQVQSRGCLDALRGALQCRVGALCSRPTSSHVTTAFTGACSHHQAPPVIKSPAVMTSRGSLACHRGRLRQSLDPLATGSRRQPLLPSRSRSRQGSKGSKASIVMACAYHTQLATLLQILVSRFGNLVSSGHV